MSVFNVPKIFDVPLLVLWIQQFVEEGDKQVDSFSIMCMMMGVFTAIEVLKTGT